MTLVLHIQVSQILLDPKTVFDTANERFEVVTHSLKSAGANCLKVVASEMGGTTAIEVHCSGSWPTWVALVAKLGSFSR